MKTFSKPSDAIKWSKEKLLNHGYVVQTERWQGIPSPDDMWETMNLSFQMFIPHTLEELRNEVRPNLPWADDHFEERIGGQPLNPPPSNEWWPFNQKKTRSLKKTKSSPTPTQNDSGLSMLQMNLIQLCLVSGIIMETSVTL